MFNFLLTLVPPKELELEHEEVLAEGGRCMVNCLVTSCKIECSVGTKPKCYCDWLFANCGCEPLGN